MSRSSHKSPSSRYIGLRLPVSLYERMARKANEEDRLISEYVRELLLSAEAMEEQFEELDEELAETKEMLKRYRRMLPCNICGDPMSPTNALVEVVKEAVKDWCHTKCESE